MKTGDTATKNSRSPDTDSHDAFYKAHTELLEMVIEAKPLAEIFEKTLLLIERISPVKTWCTLKLTVRPDFRLQIAAAPSLPDSLIEDLKHLNVSPDDGTCGQAVMRRETVVCEDIANDPSNEAYHEIASREVVPQNGARVLLMK